MKIDYSPFLFVGDDREIWWPLETAAKLVAGYLPVCDDDQTLNPELRATSNQVRVNERSVYAYFNQDSPPIKLPHTEIRDGARFVRAREFLTWLDDYADAMHIQIDFPDELNRVVQAALAAATSPPDAGFTSLERTLEDYFDIPQSNLPKSIRRRVEKEFDLISWQSLSPDQRREFARQWDLKNDPALEAERQRWFSFYARMDEVNDQIRQWEAAAADDAASMAARDEKLSRLRAQLDAMQALEKADSKAGGGKRLAHAYKPHRKMDGQLIAYPKALAILKRRLNATPEEMAIWVWLTPKDGGLAAFLNANELGDAAPFYFTLGNEEDFDYVSKLMATWYRPEDLEGFFPQSRFITGSALMERWKNLDGIQVVPFVRAKIAESRLLDLHPIYGGSQWTEGDGSAYPPKEIAMFEVRLIEAVEQEDFELQSTAALGSEIVDTPERSIESDVTGVPDTATAQCAQPVNPSSSPGDDADSVQLQSVTVELTEIAAPTDSFTGEVHPVGSAPWRQLNARKAALARHAKTEAKKQALLKIWASGKYISRNRCAEEECAALDLPFKTARNALMNTPDPKKDG